MDDRKCTCHPDDNQPQPCARQYALIACREVDAIRRIRAALEAKPSTGPWTVLPAIAGEQCVARINALEIVPPRGIELARDYIDANYIAACHPFAIRALLDRLKAAEDENKRLREFERSAALTLPGVYYMDPPDGGDVSLLKQLQRMSIDAARYRLLRRKFAIISDGNGNAEFCPINFPRPTYIAPNTAIELDTALGRDAGLEEAVAACHNEGLTDNPTNGEDEAYMLAIEHCVAAIKAIKENKHDR